MSTMGLEEFLENEESFATELSKNVQIRTYAQLMDLEESTRIYVGDRKKYSIHDSEQYKEDMNFLAELIGSASWQSAKLFWKTVNARNPHRAEVYICNLMIELEKVKEVYLVGYGRKIEEMEAFQKAWEYADEKIRRRLKLYTQEIAEPVKKEKQYQESIELLISAKKEDSAAIYRTAIDCLEQIADYDDAKEKMEEAYQAIYNKGNKWLEEKDDESALHCFERILEYKDANEIYEVLREKMYQKIKEAYESGDYKRMDSVINICHKLIPYKDTVTIYNEIKEKQRVGKYEREEREQKIFNIGFYAVLLLGLWGVIKFLSWIMSFA